MSHRPHLRGGTRHKARCACNYCDPEQLLVRQARERYLAEQAAAAKARAAGAAVAPASAPRTLARPFPAPPRVPSRGPDRRMKRFAELRAAGASIDEAHAQIAVEFPERS